jgi:DNA gyrase subunit B
MLGSEQIKNLVLAFGTAIGDTFDISKLRYHKIILATDADVDGAHIRTLILTLLYRYFRPLIDSGYVYIAQPPLYKVKKGKEIFYYYSDEEKIKALGKDAAAIEQAAEEFDMQDANNAQARAELLERAEAEPDAEEIVIEGGKTKAPKISIQRYKGLGEMNHDELWETTMDPARRILRQVTVDDAQDADKVFDMLMGDDVPARKSFIQSNAKHATLDI